MPVSRNTFYLVHILPGAFYLAGAQDKEYFILPIVQDRRTEMQLRWVAFIHNIIALQTLVKCKLQNVMDPGTISCLTESYLGQGHTQVTFLREERGLLLYATLWSEDMRLITCEVISNPLVIESYRTSYNKSSGENEPLYQTFNLRVILSLNASCVKTDDERRREGGEAKGRRKRSWIFPGTLWCGTGSKALGYDELGMFERADRCCREHDHCRHIIPAFTVNYGVFNPNFFTVSHCDCDQRFRQCLLDVNDTISSMVLYSFFKILKVPCIELKLQKRCTEMHWWGMCKITQDAPYAIFKRPVYYNSSFTSKYKKSDSSKSDVSEGHQLTQVHKIEPSRKRSRKEKCVFKDPPRGDTFFHKKTNECRREKGKLATVTPYLHATTTSPYLKAPSTTPTTTSSQRPATLKLSKAKASTTKNVTEHTLEKALLSPNKTPLTSTVPAVSSTKGSATAKWMFTTNLPKRQTSSIISAPHYDNNTISSLTHYLETKNQSQVVSPFGGLKANQIFGTGNMDLKQNKLLHEKTDFCESLKHLDECRYKIPPLKKRFGLKNLDTKPAYQCACTRRLTREIQKLKQSRFPSLVEDSVSENCFKLPKRKTCHHRKSCSGGFTKASGLFQALKKIKQNETAGVQNSGKHRKRRITVRLYKQCLRLRKEAMASLT